LDFISDIIIIFFTLGNYYIILLIIIIKLQLPLTKQYNKVLTLSTACLEKQDAELHSTGR